MSKGISIPVVAIFIEGVEMVAHHALNYSQITDADLMQQFSGEFPDATAHDIRHHLMSQAMTHVRTAKRLALAIVTQHAMKAEQDDIQQLRHYVNGMVQGAQIIATKRPEYRGRADMLVALLDCIDKKIKPVKVANAAGSSQQQ